MSDAPTAALLGAYVHIPFCASRCDYCAFATWTDRSHLVARYVDAVVAHIEADAAHEGDASVSSVFFGGGTPSLLAPEDLVRILAALPRTAGAEVTVECNPDTITPALVETYAAGGVNRLSIGVQSMAPHVLGALGRTHDAAHVREAIAVVQRSGLSFNLDVIYGAATETPADWSRTLDEVLAFEPHHVSAYGLTVEAGTPLARDRARHPDEDDQADKYLMATERLRDAGLEWYEISNWARPGHECRHNLLYWRQGDYLAYGSAAHGHRGGRRWWNVTLPERYIDAVAALGDDPGATVAGFEQLDPAQRRREADQLRVRTREGVALDAFRPGALEELDGLVEVRDGRVHLTVEGRLLANEVALRLV